MCFRELFEIPRTSQRPITLIPTRRSRPNLAGAGSGTSDFWSWTVYIKLQLAIEIIDLIL